MSTSGASVPGSISFLQIEHFMEVSMANSLMTEAQGDHIITLLEKAVDLLEDIKFNTGESDKTLDVVKAALGDIEANTRP